MISSDKGDPVRVPNLKGEEQEEGFHRVEAAVHKVSHEEVVRVGALTAHFEQLPKIVKLTVNITADLRGKNNSSQ